MDSLRTTSLLATLLLFGCASQPAGLAPGIELREAGAPLAPSPGTGSLANPGAAPTNWKERMAQPYVYFEEVGDYRLLAQAMQRLMALARTAGIEVTGAPFSLFYDDPGHVHASLLRGRVCLPVDARPANAPVALRFDVLPRAMVVYTRVTGPYPEVPRVYPTLLRYMGELSWSPGSPIRESYLVHPAQVETPDQLVTEVQIPWATGG